MARSVRSRFGHPIKHLRLWKSALTTAALLTLLLFMPKGLLALGSPFDPGLTAIQTVNDGQPLSLMSFART